jgi:hypothetical protein
MSKNQKDSQGIDLEYSETTEQVDKLFQEYREVSLVKNKPLQQKRAKIRQIVGEKLQKHNIPPTDEKIYPFYGIDVEIDYDNIIVSLFIHEEPGYLTREPINPDKWRKSVVETLGISENYVTLTIEESYVHHATSYYGGNVTYDHNGEKKSHSLVYRTYRATRRSYTLKINYSEYCVEE